ncbi:hypothetical protein HMPREF1497_2020, partial [Fusobacterium sp. CM21]
SISNSLLRKKGQISLHFIKENLPSPTRRLFKKFFQEQLQFLQALVLTPLYSLIAYFLSFCNAFINDIFFKMSVMIKRRKKEQVVFSVHLLQIFFMLFLTPVDLIYLLTDFHLLPIDIKVVFFFHFKSSILFLSACFQAKKGGLLHLSIRSPLK